MNTEDAYKKIASHAVAEAGSCNWDSLIVEVKIFAKMAEISHWLMDGNIKTQGDGAPPLDVRRDSFKAMLFVRDNILQTTGQRIWGLTFTLFANGKFNIEYDYNKPKVYEETEELISGDEINSSLNKIVP